MRGVWLAAALALGACVRAPEPAAPDLSLLPAARGLQVGGTGQEISFGRTQASTVDSVARVLGRGPDLALLREGCPGGTLAESRWSGDGLSLFFADGAFVGWRAGDGRSYPGPLRQAGRVCS